MKKNITMLGFLVLLSLPVRLFSQIPELVVQTGHVGQISCLAFSPNSRLIASGGGDSALILWNVDSGRQVRTMKGHAGRVTSAAFSRDGRVVASGGVDGTARLWDADSGKTVAKYGGKAAIIDSTALSPDGEILAAGGFDGSITLWAAGGLRQLAAFSGHTGNVASLAFSPDGKTLASGGHDHDVRLWDVATGRLVKLLRGHPAAVLAVAYSRDGRYIASAGGGYAGNAVVVVWDTETGKPKHKFTTTDEWISSLAFSPDGRILIGGTNTRGRALRRFDVASGVDLGTVPTKSSAVFALAYSPDGKVFAFGGDSRAVTLLDGSTLKELRTLEGRVRGIDSLVTGPDGKMLAVGSSEEIRIWDLQDVKITRKIISGDSVNALSYSPRGDMIARTGPGGVELWNTTGEKILSFPGLISPPLCAAFSPDGSLLAAGLDDGTVKIWRMSDGREFLTLAGHQDFVRALAFSPDGRKIFSGSADTTIKSWDTGTGKETGTLTGHTNWVVALAVAPDGRTLISGSGDGTARLWNTATGGTEKILREHAGRVTAVGFSPDGKTALTAGEDDTISLWDLAVVKEPRRLLARAGGVTSAAYSRDGTLILAGTRDGAVKIWNAGTGREIASLIGFIDGEWIAITPEGSFEASPDGAKYLNVRVGTEMYSIDQFYSNFYRPDLVRIALAGENPPEKETLTSVLTTKAAPSVRILSPRPGEAVDGGNVGLEVLLTDNGGGFGGVHVFLNDTQITNDTRGLSVTGKESSRDKRLTFTIPLAAGENLVKVVAANRDGSMESSPATVLVRSTAAISRPNLFAIVVGIDTYRNESISLSYAVTDAEAFAAAMQDVSAPLFETIGIKLLTTPENTTKDAIKTAFENMKPLVKPNDVFVFYDASHGIVDEEDSQYFLLTSNVLFLSSRRIAADALSQKELSNLIGDIPAGKKLVILDTCNAGKGGREISIALFQKTRGLSESTAVRLLKRATGSAVFSASSDTEQAFEGYRGHGLFTYVLIEGLRGKADARKDGFITILNLAEYVEEEVVRLSEEVFKRQQTPVIQTSTNFPIGKIAVP